MEKVDLRKQLKHLWFPPTEPVLVDVPDFTFAMVEGKGNPNTTTAFQDAIQALYAITYGAKFLRREEKTVDFKVMPLEALWWRADGLLLGGELPADVCWTAMILQPPTVTPAVFEEVREKALAKAPMAAQARFERFCEGQCVQVMHLGPYSEEGPTIERLWQFIEAQGFSAHGKHHEIYLSDPRRGDPAKLKTVLRQPVYRAGNSTPAPVVALG